MCLRNFLLFLIILPFPVVSPLFMFTFLTAMWLKLKPCVYCSCVVSLREEQQSINSYTSSPDLIFDHSQLIIFFFAASTPSYLSLSFPEDPLRPSPPIWLHANQSETLLEQARRGNDQTFLYSAPIANRSWVDLNHGRLLWPKLEGYRLLDPNPNEKKGRAQVSRALEAALTKKLPSHTEEAEPVEPAAPHAVSSSDSVEATPKPQRRWFNRPGRLSRKGSVPKPAIQSQVPAAVATAADPTPPDGPEPVEPEYEYEYAEDIETDEIEYDTNDAQLSPSTIPPSRWYSYIFHPDRLPSRYDLRYNGIGFVLDLGRGRTEQAVKQEVKEWRAWEAGKKRKAKEQEPKRERVGVLEEMRRDQGMREL